MEEVDKEQMKIEKKSDEFERLNDYEKVILAAKLARKINNTRIVAGEQLAPEEINKLDRRKVTTTALEELDSGNVQISRQREEPSEETYDLT
ncbi:MAG: DNA-directed RNA polymerase subunit omega [Candidatus Zixiibacteriota bacterium]|nr:MAG: DNA-directed RNA polymerase subunit omega [candidate division Zixibacteria bacterium]